MARATASTDIGTSADLARLAREVAASGTPRLLTKNGAALAVVAPAVPRRRRTPRPRPLTRDNPIWDVVGSITADVGSETSENTHVYLAEAHATDEP